MKQDNNYDSTSELIEAVNSNLLETVVDLSELNIKAAVQALAENKSILAEIPVLKWMISGVKIISAVSTILAIRKFNAFIMPIKDSNIFETKDYKKQLEEICGSKKKLDFVIEQTLFSLDKYETEIKAKWLANLFIATFKKKKFTVDEYNGIQFSINYLNPITSIKPLEFYYKYHKQKEEGIIDDQLEKNRVNIDYSSLALSGFIRLPTGGTYFGSLGGAYINDLGIRFYENVIVENEE